MFSYISLVSGDIFRITTTNNAAANTFSYRHIDESYR